VQSAAGKLSCNKTALKRCTKTEILLLLVVVVVAKVAVVIAILTVNQQLLTNYFTHFCHHGIALAKSSPSSFDKRSTSAEQRQSLSSGQTDQLQPQTGSAHHIHCHTQPKS